MDGPPPPEEDFSSLPVSDRLGHKNWKARVSAYESLVKTFQNTASDNDPAFKPYANHPDTLKKIATDTNAVAQEKGLECIVAFVKFAGETAAKTRETVMPALVDKCYGSSRAGTKAHAVELALQYTEVENSGAGVVNDLIAGLGAKQPKTVSGCVLALREVLRAFGIQATPPPPILKVLPKIFSHSDKTVRAEGTTLAQIIYQYIGPGIDPWLADLKPVQVKELKESFESLDKDGKGKGTLKPDRMTRAAAREAELAGNDEGADGEAEVVEEDLPMDPRQFADIVDVVPKLPASLQTSLTSSKWKDRKEVLDEVATLLSSTPRIKEASELGDLARSLATRIQSDANINCVMAAAVCMEHLAKGLMAAFAKYHETVVPPMLERLKERKANVTDTIGAALDAIFLTTNLSDIIPDLGAALGHKNPQVKEGTLKFLGRSLATATTPIQQAQIKPLADSLATLLEDSYEGARNEAAVCIGTLMKMVGERPLNAVVESVADVRKAKIKEAFEKATVKCKLGSGGPPKAAPKAAPPSTAASKKKAAPADDTSEASTPPPPKKVAKPPARLTAKGGAAASGASAAPAAAAPKKLPPAAAAASKPSKAPASVPGGLDTFKYKHTPEDAEALAAEQIPASILTDFADANWKTRIAALEELATWVDGAIDEIDAEVLIRALAKKGWSDKNFQVSAKIYGVCATLAERCPSFGRSCAALCVPHMSEKLGDLKLKKPSGDALIAFAERTSLQFVLNQAYEPLSKQKAPKVLADAITWINASLTDFGISGVSLRSLIDFLKVALQNSNAAVRTSATKAMVTVKLFAGPSIKDLIQDLNPQLLNTITSEFDKTEGTSPPEPTRTSADVASVATSSGAGAIASGGDDALDDLFPRVEIDGLMKGTTILADAKSDAWKTKKEALEALQAILDQGSNKRLKPSMGEISGILKARVTDTNKAVQLLALDIVARIATGMGKPFEKQNRFFVHPLTTVLSDQKAHVRTAALHALTAIATACESFESLVPGIHSGMETTNPMQKGTLLNWINEWFKEHPPPASLDLSTLAAPVVGSLDDRNGDVRKGAVTLLPTLITCCGFDYVLQQANSLKPASRGSAVPTIQAARQSAAPAQVSAPAPKSAKAAPKAAPAATPSPPPESPPPSAAPKTGSKLLGMRRKLPQGGSRPESRAEGGPEPTTSRLSKAPAALKRPGGASASTRPAAAEDSASSSHLPLTGTNPDSRKTRCGKDSSKWINESGTTRKDLAEALQAQMEPLASKELVARLFSHDHNAVNDHVTGITTLCDFYNSAQTGDEKLERICLATYDLPLKYASIKAHEPQSNVISKSIELVETVLAFLRATNQQLTDNEALCFIPTFIYKLGDAREQVRVRVQQIIQSLPKVYAYSRLFQLLLDYGLKSKVAKTRQGTLDEMAGILKKSGMGACEPSKAFPVLGHMIADKDSSVRKSALSVISEGYMLVGEKVWSMIGPLSPKDKTQLEERLRRVAGPSTHENVEPIPPPQIARLTGLPRPGSPATGPRIGGLSRPESPAATSRLPGIPRPGSPAGNPRFGGIPRPGSPGPSKLARPVSPAMRPLSPPAVTHRPASPSRIAKAQPNPSSPTAIGRPKTMLPSRLGRPRSHFAPPVRDEPEAELDPVEVEELPQIYSHRAPALAPPAVEESADITVTISSILSSDPSRSVDALKKVQRILSAGSEGGSAYRDLAEHAEGLVETITLQMAHVFERLDELISEENFRLAKHLIQTLNNFCDHAVLAESLTVDILTSLLEELTLRLLETDDSPVKKVKDLSRFINMIILRLFATGRRMSIFKALFVLLLQVVKPFPSHGTAPDSREAKVAELVLKCVWKLARSIPQDLTEQKLDPVELFPTIEHFLQSVPPNEWRARATNKVPCGDMPLRTIKVIIQHVVAHYGDDVYDLLSASFDDPSATIVYPYVYRILNSATKPAPEAQQQLIDTEPDPATRPLSTASSRPLSPQDTASGATSPRNSVAPSHRTSPSVNSLNGNGNGAHPHSPISEEPDPDAQLLEIIGHISSETTGALHKEGITELHHFLKAHPGKRPRVDKMLDSTGAAFRKYITRALASRAAEDKERDVAVLDAFDKLENRREPLSPRQSLETRQSMETRQSVDLRRSIDSSPRSPSSPRRSLQTELPDNQDRLSKLHNLFQYRSSTDSARITPSISKTSM